MLVEHNIWSKINTKKHVGPTWLLSTSTMLNVESIFLVEELWQLSSILFRTPNEDAYEFFIWVQDCCLFIYLLVLNLFLLRPLLRNWNAKRRQNRQPWRSNWLIDWSADWLRKMSVGPNLWRTSKNKRRPYLEMYCSQQRLFLTWAASQENTVTTSWT